MERKIKMHCCCTTSGMALYTLSQGLILAHNNFTSNYRNNDAIRTQLINEMSRWYHGILRSIYQYITAQKFKKISNICNNKPHNQTHHHEACSRVPWPNGPLFAWWSLTNWKKKKKCTAWNKSCRWTSDCPYPMRPWHQEFYYGTAFGLWGAAPLTNALGLASGRTQCKSPDPPGLWLMI